MVIIIYKNIVLILKSTHSWNSTWWFFFKIMLKSLIKSLLCYFKSRFLYVILLGSPHQWYFFHRRWFVTRVSNLTINKCIKLKFILYFNGYMLVMDILLKSWFWLWTWIRTHISSLPLYSINHWLFKLYIAMIIYIWDVMIIFQIFFINHS